MDVCNMHLISLRTSYLNVQVLFYYSGQQQLQDMYVQKYFYFGYYVTQQLHSDYLCLSIPDLQCNCYDCYVVNANEGSYCTRFNYALMYIQTLDIWILWDQNTYTLPCTLIIQPHNLLFSFPPIFCYYFTFGCLKTSKPEN